MELEAKETINGAKSTKYTAANLTKSANNSNMTSMSTIMTKQQRHHYKSKKKLGKEDKQLLPN